MSALRPYLALYAGEFRTRLAYLPAFFGGMATNAVFGVIRTYIMLGVLASAGGAVAGYDRGLLIANTWISQALLGVIGAFVLPAFADRVKSGDIATDLLRPTEVQTHWLAVEFGRSTFELMGRSVLLVGLGFFVFGGRVGAEPLSWVLGAATLVLSVALSYYLRFIVCLIVLWTLDHRALMQFYIGVSTFLGGLMLPVHLFPPWLKSLAYASPFPHLFQTPADVISGYVTGVDALVLVGIQLGWVAAVAVVGQLVLARGRRTVVIQGG